MELQINVHKMHKSHLMVFYQACLAQAQKFGYAIEMNRDGDEYTISMQREGDSER